MEIVFTAVLTISVTRVTISYVFQALDASCLFHEFTDAV